MSPPRLVFHRTSETLLDDHNFRHPQAPIIMLPPNVLIIPKEQVSSLRFPRQSLMLTEVERSGILQSMEEATRLGNAEHGKCRIVFQDDEGLKAVETTIWTFDPENIVLKYGMVIPVARVVSVDIP